MKRRSLHPNVFDARDVHLDTTEAPERPRLTEALDGDNRHDREGTSNNLPPATEPLCEVDEYTSRGRKTPS
jgi:hypothetical protein